MMPPGSRPGMMNFASAPTMRPMTIAAITRTLSVEVSRQEAQRRCPWFEATWQIGLRPRRALPYFCALPDERRVSR
jgi:hypothetical protein